MTCLKIAMTSFKFDCASDIVKIAERVRKILYDRQIRPHSVISDSSFPKILEKEVEQFMISNSLHQT